MTRWPKYTGTSALQKTFFSGRSEVSLVTSSIIDFFFSKDDIKRCLKWYPSRNYFSKTMRSITCDVISTGLLFFSKDSIEYCLSDSRSIFFFLGWCGVCISWFYPARIFFFFITAGAREGRSAYWVNSLERDCPVIVAPINSGRHLGYRPLGVVSNGLSPFPCRF